MSIRSKASPRAILIVVAFGIFIAADDLTVVTTMLRPIINDLGIVLPDGIDDAAWIVNVYLIAYVAVMPFMGRLSDVLGRRRVFIGALSLFVVGSVIIPNTTTLGPFLFGRVLTAMGGGALVPIVAFVTMSSSSSDGRARHCTQSTAPPSRTGLRRPAAEPQVAVPLQVSRPTRRVEFAPVRR